MKHPNLPFPCPDCGTQNQVKSDAECTFCTTCGSKIELGIHSYRTQDSSTPNIFCKDCKQLLDHNIQGTIFSCYSCGEIICNVCAKLVDNKRFCKKCFTKLQPTKLKRPKKTKRKRKIPHKK